MNSRSPNEADLNNYALLKNRGTMKLNSKLKHTFNGGEKDLKEQNTKSLRQRRNYETLILTECKSCNGDDHKRLQQKITPKTEEQNQTMKLTVIKLKLWLRNKLQQKGYALQEDRSTAGSRVLWKLWFKTLVELMTRNATHWHGTEGDADYLNT